MNYNIAINSNTTWRLMLGFLACAVFMMPELAMAQTPMGETLCRIVAWFTGTTGRALATLAIIIIGVGALMGKVSWGMAIIVALGVAVVFGADQIMQLLGGGSGGCGGGA